MGVSPLYIYIYMDVTLFQYPARNIFQFLAENPKIRKISFKNFGNFFLKLTVKIVMN